MKFALNYSSQAYQLLETGSIDIDLFKVSSDFPEHIPICKNLKPVYVHFSLIAGTNQPEPDYKAIERILSITGTVYINIHLGATGKDYPDIPVLSDAKEHKDRLIEQMLKDIKPIADRFGTENVILENWPYHGTDRSETDILNVVVDPTVISTVINESMCGLLLDIDHARAAADIRGENAKDYIEALPVAKIRELHMTGSHMIDGIMRAHLPMKEDDWEYFEWALTSIAEGRWGMPDIFAFEYGGVGELFEWRSDSNIIKNQVPEFLRRLSNRGLRD